MLNKPYDMTSTQAVGKVRWLFSAAKAGHAGTLVAGRLAGVASFHPGIRQRRPDE